MAKNTTTGGVALEIDPAKVYPLPEFMRRVGWGRHAMRSARRDGLKVAYRGGRGFVRGEDFETFLTTATAAR